MTREMHAAGRGHQNRRERPSPFGRSRLTLPSHSRPDERPQALDVAETPEELMERVRLGDQAAFARLYDQFSGQAFGLALRVCNDRTVAEDAVQEAFLSLWRRPAGYRPDRGSVATYLLTLVHHRAVDAVRHEQRLRMRERASAAGEQTEDDEGLLEAASASSLRERVRAALAQLTNRQRQALELAYFSGLTVSDVAKRLDIPLGTAKTRVRDGMIRLRSLLASEGEAQ